METEDLFKRFLEVLDALGEEGVDYILIGGFAMVLYGMPRATQDLDIFIKSREDNIARLQKALFRIFQDKSAYEITHSELNDYSVIRYGVEEGFYIDVLAKLGEAFTYEDLEFEEIDVDGHHVKIASVETLYKLKEKTFSAIDKTDLSFLKQLLKDKQ